MEENEPDKFDQFKTIVEEQHFTDPVDVVLFFEQWFAKFTRTLMRERPTGEQD